MDPVPGKGIPAVHFHLLYFPSHLAADHIGAQPPSSRRPHPTSLGSAVNRSRRPDSCPRGLSCVPPAMFQPVDLCRGEAHVRGRETFRQMSRVQRADDRDNLHVLMHQPCQRDRAGRDGAAAVADGFARGRLAVRKDLYCFQRDPA